MILADTAEPDNLIKLLNQSVPTVKTNLNKAGMADYFFSTEDGRKFQFNRVQAGELLSDVDSMEDELRRYYDKADRNYQIIEGIISPVMLHIKEAAVPVSEHSPAKFANVRDLGSKLYSYKVEPTGFIPHGHSFRKYNDSALAAWIHRLGEAGIATYYTVNWIHTARTLSVIYKNEQKPQEEHSTLQRVVKPKIRLRKAEPLLKAIMFLSSAYELGVGEKKAQAIVERFCNLLDIATADVSELCECEGIGRVLAEKILRALGREV